MFTEERLNEILKLLREDGKVLVKNLSETFGVSEGMIRKDLQKLEKEGLLKRTYGGAILERKIVYDDSILYRLAKNIDRKNGIANIAINLIEENDVIFLDASSINYSIAAMLSSISKKLTLITNMNRIAIMFDNNPFINVICIGGIYNKNLGATIGSVAISEIESYRINKSFIGAGGINIENNFISNIDLDEAMTKKAIIKNSKNIYIVMENEKFYTDCFYKFSKLEEINAIITDKKPEDNIMNKLIDKEISIIY
ncbi:DeoR/GlpR family DNA-binding transcription regulator [Clostridium tarantellae]|uniref:DeoR family transcriptional regulator n=1 Tax=Clostridium tarantellae TaxID=39493 RepID=A0A6I1MUJ9_9CLOT|nr:DeoR/GlpR family DNA-binding transcription regulator [Clostridium tarantellae]MPQ43889.1 DeoR family transcriptional regulator [Clostridium tarantellae]